MDNPQFLIQQNPRLSIKESEKIIDEILRRLNIFLPTKNRNRQSIIKGKGTENEIHIKYSDLVKQIRENGICEIQKDLDRMDEVFGGTFAMSSPTWHLKTKTEWAGYSKELQGPFRNVPSESDISDDIEFYKEETCIESCNYDFDMVARNYRGYLFSTIALIDSYINRHIILFDFKGRKSNRFLELKESKNTEQRIELFIDEFCNFTFTDFIKSREWSDFKKLKTLRNEVIHSVNPFLGISIQEIASNLNLSINGIGNFLKRLQEGQNRISLGFIEKVRTSPIIHYNQVTIKSEGKFEEKKYINKISR